MNLMSLERHTTQTLLGVRFWDRATNRVIADGLRVTAQRLSSDRTQRLGKPIPGKITPSGAIAFFGLAPDELLTAGLLWETVPPNQLVVIDVVDKLERFLPMSFVTQLPLRGVFRGQGEWLNTPNTPLLRPKVENDIAIGVQLWPAPIYSALPGQAIIRAQLAIGTGNTPSPAAYALVRVQQLSSRFDYYGMTDHRGTLLLPMPYPAIPDPVTPDTPYPPLDRQTFALRITVQYENNRPILPNSSVPNLEHLLDQALANIASHYTSDSASSLQFQPDLSVNLQFGHPLVLRTVSRPGATEAESVLRIQPT